MRRWFRCGYEVEKRLRRAEDHYEIIIEGEIVHAESYFSSPFLTRYTVEEALASIEGVGLIDMHARADFRLEPATPGETSYIVLDRRF